MDHKCFVMFFQIYNTQLRSHSTSYILHEIESFVSWTEREDMDICRETLNVFHFFHALENTDVIPRILYLAC